MLRTADLFGTASQQEAQALYLSDATRLGPRNNDE